MVDDEDRCSFGGHDGRPIAGGIDGRCCVIVRNMVIKVLKTYRVAEDEDEWRRGWRCGSLEPDLADAVARHPSRRQSRFHVIRLDRDMD